MVKSVVPLAECPNPNLNSDRLGRSGFNLEGQVTGNRHSHTAPLVNGMIDTFQLKPFMLPSLYPNPSRSARTGDAMCVKRQSQRDVSVNLASLSIKVTA
jgi:hypothetical protein